MILFDDPDIVVAEEEFAPRKRSERMPSIITRRMKGDFKDCKVKVGCEQTKREIAVYRNMIRVEREISEARRSRREKRTQSVVRPNVALAQEPVRAVVMARAIPRRQAPRTTTAFVSRQQEQWRGNASERGYDETWKRVAAQRREMDENLCQHCLKEGGLAQAMESLARSTHAQPVDHIVPLHVRPDWRLELSNLQTLCVSHNKKKSDIDTQMYGSAPMDESRLTMQQRANRSKAQEFPWCDRIATELNESTTIDAMG